MTSLATCSSCRAFVPAGAAACPHCDAARVPDPAPALRRIGRGVLSAAVGGSIAMTLMACYGGPPAHWQPPSTGGGADCGASGDVDRDGVCAPADCDDEDPTRTDDCDGGAGGPRAPGSTGSSP